MSSYTHTLGGWRQSIAARLAVEVGPSSYRRLNAEKQKAVIKLIQSELSLDINIWKCPPTLILNCGSFATYDLCIPL